MKIYLDTSVCNRPFDEQMQPRIWLETIALSMILQLIRAEKIELISSSVLSFENANNPFPDRKKWVNACVALSKRYVILTDAIKQRGQELEQAGFKPFDALHLACAEAETVDYFLTCDDKVVKRYRQQPMIVCNPVEFILKATERESYDTYHDE